MTWAQDQWQQYWRIVNTDMIKDLHGCQIKSTLLRLKVDIPFRCNCKDKCLMPHTVKWCEIILMYYGCKYSKFYTSEMFGCCASIILRTWSFWGVEFKSVPFFFITIQANDILKNVWIHLQMIKYLVWVFDLTVTHYSLHLMALSVFVKVN